MRGQWYNNIKHLARCMIHLIAHMWNLNCWVTHFLSSYRRCSRCSKKRSLRSNTFFTEFPKVALGKLLLAIYYFLQDDPQHRAARALDFKPPLVSKIFRRLQDVCSVDLENRPFIPFGGPGTAAKCDESKFNHRPKVNMSTLSHCHVKGTGRARSGNHTLFFCKLIFPFSK